MAVVEIPDSTGRLIDHIVVMRDQEQRSRIALQCNTAFLNDEIPQCSFVLGLIPAVCWRTAAMQQYSLLIHKNHLGHAVYIRSRDEASRYSDYARFDVDGTSLDVNKGYDV